MFLYLLVRTIAQSEEGVEWILQAKLQRRVSFLILAFCIPNSPSLFVLVMVSYLHFLLRISGPPCEVPLNSISKLKTSPRKEVILLHMISIPLREVLAKIVLPVMLRKLIFHPTSSLLIFSMIN